MSKGLEALEYLKNKGMICGGAIGRGCVDDIEKDLNDYEEIKEIMRNHHCEDRFELNYKLCEYEEMLFDSEENRKKLEILQLIKDKKVNVGYLMGYKDYSKYKEALDNKWTIIKQLSSCPLTETEFNLIKERLEK